MKHISEEAHSMMYVHLVAINGIKNMINYTNRISRRQNMHCIYIEELKKIGVYITLIKSFMLKHSCVGVKYILQVRKVKRYTHTYLYVVLLRSHLVLCF